MTNLCLYKLGKTGRPGKKCLFSIECDVNDKGSFDAAVDRVIMAAERVGFREQGLGIAKVTGATPTGRGVALNIRFNSAISFLSGIDFIMFQEAC